jgi:hypothetical protein
MAGGTLPALRRFVLMLLRSVATARLLAATATFGYLVAVLAAAVLHRALTAAPPKRPCRADYPGSCRRIGSTCLTLGPVADFRYLGPPLGPLTSARTVVLWTMCPPIALQTRTAPLVLPSAQLVGGLILPCSRLGRLASLRRILQFEGDLWRLGRCRATCRRRWWFAVLDFGMMLIALTRNGRSRVVVLGPRALLPALPPNILPFGNRSTTTLSVSPSGLALATPRPRCLLRPASPPSARGSPPEPRRLVAQLHPGTLLPTPRPARPSTASRVGQLTSLVS